MFPTKEMAACSIYGLEFTTENAEKALKDLDSVGLIPVYLKNGDPSLAVAIGKKKLRMEPWKYGEFNSERKETLIPETQSEDTSESFDITSRTIIYMKTIVPMSKSFFGVFCILYFVL